MLRRGEKTGPPPILAYKRSILDPGLRRIVPSISRLTYSPLFRVAINALSWMAALPFPELRRLPPAHLRARVGTGNRILFNHFYYYANSIWYWFDNFSRGLVNLSSSVVEIGCGCGRTLQHLHNTLEFSGTFTGIDIDQEMLDWCQKSFSRPGFRFIKSPHLNSSYSERTLAEFSENSTPATRWRVPLDDNSTDFVYSCSLLTHLLEEDVTNYLQESCRILRPASPMRMSFFCVDWVEKGGRWNFTHKMGGAYVESLRVPEAAVAYRHEDILRMCKEAGFARVEFRPSTIQSEVIAWKA